MAAAIETKLYVTNFPSSATRQQLQQFFSRFGRVQECAIMWNSYAFVHYASIDEARRALDQSNGAMFLNRKLIVQLSTSRFRPQPKENNNFQSKPLLNSNGSSFHPLAHAGDSSVLLQQQQQSNGLSQQFSNELKFDAIHNFNSQTTSSLSGATNFFSGTFRPPSPFHLSSQEINGNFYPPYSGLTMDRMTPSPLSLQSHKFNPMIKSIKPDIGHNGEIPKLYCTNLPENCKANDLQCLFSTFGQVVDCVILWDYYAFITFQTFTEAERALAALHGYNWHDRRLIVEWSRASGRRQQQPPQQLSLSATQQQQQSTPSPSTSGFGSFVSNISTPPSPRPRPSSLITSSNGQYFGNISPKLVSPMKSQSTHHQGFPMMPVVPSPCVRHSQQHHVHPNFLNFTNRTNGETLNGDNRPMFEDLTRSSSGHGLDISPFMDSTGSNSNPLFPSPSSINESVSPTSMNPVYQPSDIASFLEPTSDGILNDRKSTENSMVQDVTNTFSNLSLLPSANLQTSCSTAAAAAASAHLQENIINSWFDSFEPFNRYFSNDDSTNPTSTTTRLNSLLTKSPLLTTAPDHAHHPIYFGQTTAWN